MLAFGLSWWTWPLVAVNPDSSPMVPFGPLVAAVIAAALTGGRRELGRLVTQLGPEGLASYSDPAVAGSAARVAERSRKALVRYRPASP